jgi:hypothetical protein
VVTIGRFPRFSFGFDLQAHLPHQPLDSFLVDAPFFAVQLFRDPTVAVSRPCRGHGLDGGSVSCIVSLFWLMVVAASATAQQVAQQMDRIVVGKHLDHLSFLLK